MADSFKYPNLALDVNTHGTLNILQAARLVMPEARYFFASSSKCSVVAKLLDLAMRDTLLSLKSIWHF